MMRNIKTWQTTKLFVICDLRLRFNRQLPLVFKHYEDDTDNAHSIFILWELINVFRGKFHCLFNTFITIIATTGTNIFQLDSRYMETCSLHTAVAFNTYISNLCAQLSCYLQNVFSTSSKMIKLIQKIFNYFIKTYRLLYLKKIKANWCAIL